MKKPVTKLMLNQETIRMLANDQLTRVVGGVADNCPDITKLESGCTAPAYTIVWIPTGKQI